MVFFKNFFQDRFFLRSVMKEQISNASLQAGLGVMGPPVDTVYLPGHLMGLQCVIMLTRYSAAASVCVQARTCVPPCACVCVGDEERARERESTSICACVICKRMTSMKNTVLRISWHVKSHTRLHNTLLTHCGAFSAI